MIGAIILLFWLPFAIFTAGFVIGFYSGKKRTVFDEKNSRTKPRT